VSGPSESSSCHGCAHEWYGLTALREVLWVLAVPISEVLGRELAVLGVRPPTLRNVGVEIPMPEYFDKDAEHIIAMESVLLSDGYDELHPLVKQALREHHNAHLERLHTNAMGIAGQMAPSGAQAPPPPDSEPPPSDSGGSGQDQPPQDNKSQEANSDSQQ
ncbi:MAG: hypothetical protein EBS84_22360, partial [Proteobacteria bacterium]|nr:hypothetical protein [Pseudomonadota bacterium]